MKIVVPMKSSKKEIQKLDNQRYQRLLKRYRVKYNGNIPDDVMVMLEQLRAKFEAEKQKVIL